MTQGEATSATTATVNCSALRRLHAAVNAHDARAVAALCAEHVVWEDPAAPGPLLGRAAVHDGALTAPNQTPTLLVTYSLGATRRHRIAPWDEVAEGAVERQTAPPRAESKRP